MRVLVIGGTGFVSGEVVRWAVGAGHSVTLFHRGETPRDEGVVGAIPAIHGDVERLVEHSAALRALEPQVVVHAVAFTERHGRDLVEALGPTGARLIVLSSMDCYAAFQAVARGGDPGALPVDEDGALAEPFYWRHRPGAKKHADYDKNQLTATLLAAQAERRARVTVLRLPMVWGPRDRQLAHRHGDILRRIIDGRKTLVVGAATQARLWPFGYVENVAAAVVHAMGHPESDGQVYNVGETRVRSWRAWAELYARAAGVEVEVRVLPDELLADDADEARDRPAPHLVFDCTRFERHTGFEPPVPIEEAVRRNLDWVRAHPEALGEAPDYAREDRLLAAFADAVERLRAS